MNIIGTEIVDAEQISNAALKSTAEYQAEKTEKYASRIVSRMLTSVKKGIYADTTMGGPVGIFDTRDFIGCDEQDVFSQTVEGLELEGITAAIYKHRGSRGKERNWIVVSEHNGVGIDPLAQTDFYDNARLVFPPETPEQV